MVGQVMFCKVTGCFKQARIGKRWCSVLHQFAILETSTVTERSNPAHNIVPLEPRSGPERLIQVKPNRTLLSDLALEYKSRRGRDDQ